jgi:hypothetical protein
MISIRDDDFFYMMNSAFRTSTSIFDIVNHLERYEKKLLASNKIISNPTHHIKSLIRFLINSSIEKKNHPVPYK